MRFLTECTSATGPRRVTLAINSDEETEPALIEEIKESAVATLGLHSSPNDRREYGVRGRSLMWTVAPEQAAALVVWRHALGPMKSNWLGGPALVSMEFKFRFTAAPGGDELPYQGSTFYGEQAYDGYGALLGESVCRLTLSARSSLSVLFFLPFETPTPELWQYVGFLQSRLPFELSEKHWKHWHPTKKGTSYVGSKIKNPELGRACPA
jgi:hypothetical protein